MYWKLRDVSVHDIPPTNVMMLLIKLFLCPDAANNGCYKNYLCTPIAD